MWFIIRAAFWFAVVLVMLPVFDRDATSRLEQEKGVELTDALGAAAGAISYVSALCSEKPDVCVKGAETFAALGSRAREGARVAFTYLDTHFSPEAETEDGESDAVLTGTVAAADDEALSADVPARIPVPVPRPDHG
jgi:hypothetical protein